MDVFSAIFLAVLCSSCLAALPRSGGNSTNSTLVSSTSHTSTWSSQTSLDSLASPSRFSTLIGPTTSKPSNSTLLTSSDDGRKSVFTQSFTVLSGTANIAWGEDGRSTLTLTGPTTFITTGTVQLPPPSTSTSMPARCYSTGHVEVSDRLVTYVTRVVVQSGQTLSEQAVIPVYDNSSRQIYLTGTVTKVLTGPTTVQETHTTQIIPHIQGQDWLMAHQAPDPCNGRCGYCSIYFPSIDVYFWPVTSTNMACLNRSTPVTSQASRSSAKIGAREVSLVGDASGRMVKNGFTFTSPSVYLGVPAISAVDACGLLGEARTSITISVAPGELSTYRGIGNLFSYNFADILCPPVQDDDAFSFLGQGYRPLISPPAHLRSLDPLWSNCNLGPFQGNDPPRALNPVAAMDPMTTAVDPAAIHQPATPAFVPPSPPTITVSASKSADPNPSVIPGAADPSQISHPSPAPVPADTPASNNDKQTAASTSAHPKAQPQPSQESKPDGTKGSSPADPKAQPQPSQENNGGDLKGSGPVNPNDQSRPSPGNSVVDPKTSNAAGSDPPSQPSQYVDSQDQPSATITFQHMPDSSVVYPGPTGVNNKPDILATAAANQQEAPKPVIVGGLTFSPLAIPSITLTNNRPGTPQGSAIAVVAGQTVQMGLSGVEVNSMILTPGAAPLTVSGTPVSVGSSRVVIGSDTYTLPSPTPAPIVTVAGQVITASPSQLTFGAATLTLGGPPMVISGTPISLGSSTLIIGSRTIALPTSSVLSVAGVTFTADPSGFRVGGTTLTRGGAPVTISGTVVSLGSSALHVGSSVDQLPPESNPERLTVTGGQVFTTNVDGFVVGSNTLRQGGPAATISGTVVSFGPSGLIVGSSTVPLASTPSVFVVGSQSFTANPTGFSIAGTSISAGGPGVTISGTPVSLSPSGLVISTNTYQLLDVFTVGGHIFTANPTGFAVDGTTISPGGPGTTVAGTPVSLGLSNSLFIGSSAIPLHTESNQGLGPAILSGLGLINPAQTSSRPSVNGTVQAYDGSYATLNSAKPILSLFTTLLCIILGVLV